MYAALPLLLAACGDFLGLPLMPEGGDRASGSGRVIVRLSGGDVTGRTLVPAVSRGDFDSFDLEFTADGKSSVQKTGVSAAQILAGVEVTLAVKTDWTVTAVGYAGKLSTVVPAAKTAAGYTFYVSEDAASDPVFVNLKLEAYTDPSVKGFFSWDPLLARNLGLSTATLRIYPAGSAVASNTFNLLAVSETYNPGKVELDPGYYRVVLSTTAGGISQGGLTELAHVYSGLETKFAFSAEDFLDSKPLGGTLSVVITGDLQSLSPGGYIRISAHDPNSNAPLASTGLGISENTWQMRIPMQYESVKLVVDFLADSAGSVPVLSETRLITGIGTGGEKGKTNLYFTYNGASRSITSTVNNAGNAANTIAVTNGIAPVTTVISGQTVWITVNRAPYFVLKNLGFSVEDGGSFDLLHDEYYQPIDPSRREYSFEVPVNAIGNITVNAEFESIAAARKLVCYGDSVTFGIADGNWAGKEGDETLTYPHILGTKLNNVTVINSGINGHRLESAMDYLDAEVITHNPQVIIVFLGVNDFTMEYEDKIDGFTFYEFQRRYHELLRNLSNGTRQIYVVKFFNETMFKSFLASMNVAPDKIDELYAKYTALYDSLKTSYGVTLINDVWKDIVWNNPEWDYFSEGVHPNVAGYQVMAQNFADFLLNDPGFLLK
jgi:lysophospholipase L1-like esterase